MKQYILRLALVFLHDSCSPLDKNFDMSKIRRQVRNRFILFHIKSCLLITSVFPGLHILINTKTMNLQLLYLPPLSLQLIQHPFHLYDCNVVPFT